MTQHKFSDSFKVMYNKTDQVEYRLRGVENSIVLLNPNPITVAS